MAEARVVAPADEIGSHYCANCHVGKIVSDDVTNMTGSTSSEKVRGYHGPP